MKYKDGRKYVKYRGKDERDSLAATCALMLLVTVKRPMLSYLRVENPKWRSAHIPNIASQYSARTVMCGCACCPRRPLAKLDWLSAQLGGGLLFELFS